ncbi:uncharacterized protein LTR77_001116 [Saxophila tyrrhenica]|uniref:Uncharacterized protein n=1 Tax=Saxophila tyrrhenica TaxID=1690608 RepID=A0AAV9PMD6_9PEZI|nr:hypothetical protein LTR77_001116 [Saxophila tyrrhenica]
MKVISLRLLPLGLAPSLWLARFLLSKQLLLQPLTAKSSQASRRQDGDSKYGQEAEEDEWPHLVNSCFMCPSFHQLEDSKLMRLPRMTRDQICMEAFRSTRSTAQDLEV